MKYFFNGDQFCTDLYSLMSDLELSDEDVSQLPDDWEIECEGTTERSFINIDIDELADLIMDSNQDGWPEDTDQLFEAIKASVVASVDFEKLNANMPKYHYCNGQMFKVTKQDLLDAI